jgi:hypothetical protein
MIVRPVEGSLPAGAVNRETLALLGLIQFLPAGGQKAAPVNYMHQNRPPTLL